MRIRILGGGFYGSHISSAMIQSGHEVELHEIADRLFAGASGNIPARLHAGALHYPRSHATRKACLEHKDEFMQRYGFLTRAVPINLYCIVTDRSLIDFETYREILSRDIEFITVHDPAEFGLHNVEGAVLTGERHIVTDLARDHFASLLDGHIRFGVGQDDECDDFDLTIDCTFAANSNASIARYEPCLIPLLKGRSDKAVTLMDWPGGVSLYPWNEDSGLCSLSSAQWTPFSKGCTSYAEARHILDTLSRSEIEARAHAMINSMVEFYPDVRSYKVADYRLSIRAMPASAADTRLVDVRADGKTIYVRAGKIDAIIAAEKAIKAIIGCA